MPDKNSRERLKKKVLDRWENEGGKISAEQSENIDNAIVHATTRDGETDREELDGKTTE
jgi:hypothetical protein